MGDKSHGPTLRLFPRGARELAALTAQYGDRLDYFEARPHPSRPADGVVWHPVLKGGDASRAVDVVETANDTWWCPPWCGGGG